MTESHRMNASAAAERWTAWWNRHRPRLHRFVARMVGEREAEDILQDVMVRVFQSDRDVEGESGMNAWVFTIAHNTCIDRLRKVRNRPSEGITEATVPAAAPADPGREELREAVWRAVTGLPEDQRQIFLLREEAGMTFREIARMLDIPLNTALGRMHYALEKLRKSLAGYR